MLNCLAYPITKIGFYQIEFNPDWCKINPEFECFAFWPSFRRGLNGGWENLMGNSWEEVSPPEEEILENWFKQQQNNIE